VNELARLKTNVHRRADAFVDTVIMRGNRRDSALRFQVVKRNRDKFDADITSLGLNDEPIDEIK